jgi:hypothetical protein
MGTGLALIGAIFNAKANKNGYLFLNLGNIFTMTGAILTSQWYLFVMILGFSVINSYGYFNWKSKKIGI